jgi:ligand-binding sensor domain-containing protein
MKSDCSAMVPRVLILLLSLFWSPLSSFGQVKTSNAGFIPKIKRSTRAVALVPDQDTLLVSQFIRSIFQDSKGNMWFGTLSEGVVRYDQKTLTYFSNQEGFINNTVYAINEDKQGNMWFGTDEGVYKYDGMTFKHYGQQQGLAHTDITRKGILVDRLGTIWVGTHGGVYQYDPLSDRQGGQSFSLFTLVPAINVAGILEDSRGNIWIASSGKGVFRYDGRSVTHFNQKDGLGENYAGGIAQDKAGHMWFTMKKGICKFDGKVFTEYTTRDGLGGTEFWGIIIEKSGIIWITARGSTTKFDPSKPLSDPKAFTVFRPADGLNCCVQSMYQDRSGRMWWGTAQGLYRFDGTRFYQVKKAGPW